MNSNLYLKNASSATVVHIDSAVMHIPGTGLSLRSDLAATLFLADPDEYDGGELEVVDLYGTHEVKLAAGDAIVYPSGSVHQVRPVTRGERVASFLWTQSMVREDGKRAMLFDLDTHIQALRGEPITRAAWPVRMLDRFPLLRRIPGRLIGLGIRRERVRSPNAFR